MQQSVKRRTVLAVLAAAGLTVLPVPAATATTGPGLITGRAPGLHPEGIAYDKSRRAFLVSSVRHGTVSVVRQDGTVRTLVNDPTLVSAIGIQVDAKRGRLLVVNGDLGLSVRTSPQTQQRLAGLGVYDLRTGHRLAYADLTAVAADGGTHLANDVAVAADGTAYVTDSFAPIVYRVPLRGRATVFLRDPRLATTSYGLDGIVWQNGRLVLGKYDDGTLWTVRTQAPNSLRQVRLNRPITGPDGLTLLPSGALAVITNGLGSPGADAVVTLRPTPSWRSATVTGEQSSPDPAPTTAAVGPNGLHVLSGRLDRLVAGQPADTFTIRRYPYN